MAWRPNDLITEGAVAFDDEGNAKGVLQFNGLDRPVKLDLTGCPPRLRGTRLTFRSNEARDAHHVSAHDVRPARAFMEGFALLQRGFFDDFGIDGSRLTLAWYSDANQRVYLEFDAAVRHEARAGAPAA